MQSGAALRGHPRHWWKHSQAPDATLLLHIAEAEPPCTPPPPHLAHVLAQLLAQQRPLGRGAHGGKGQLVTADLQGAHVQLRHHKLRQLACTGCVCVGGV